MKAFPWCKMKTSSNPINFKRSMNIASFTILIFYLLEKAFSFALENQKKKCKKSRDNIKPESRICFPKLGSKGWKFLQNIKIPLNLSTCSIKISSSAKKILGKRTCKETWSIKSTLVIAHPFRRYASWTSSHELQQSSSDCTIEREKRKPFISVIHKQLNN